MKDSVGILIHSIRILTLSTYSAPCKQSLRVSRCFGQFWMYLQLSLAKKKLIANFIMSSNLFVLQNKAFRPSQLCSKFLKNSNALPTGIPVSGLGFPWH